MNKNYKFSKDSKILTIKTHIGNFKFLKEETIQFPKSFNTKKYLSEYFIKESGMYCLVENKNVVYKGKSDEPLRNRIATYLIPGKRQETNKRIKNILLGKTIDIFIITENSLIKKKKLLKICENINKNYKKSKNKITINRCAEMVITGYCFGYNFLNK